MKKAATILLVVCLAGCENKDGLPSGVLNSDQMQSVLWDVVQAESFTTQFIKKDSTKNLQLENAKLQQKIFSIHNITKSDFYKSYDYYTRHVALMTVLLDSISAKAERNRYITLYNKPVVALPFSLTPLPPPPPPVIIPMPIPSSDNTLPTTQQQPVKPLPAAP